jgi:hypothetical protein
LRYFQTLPESPPTFFSWPIEFFILWAVGSRERLFRGNLNSFFQSVLSRAQARLKPIDFEQIKMKTSAVMENNKVPKIAAILKRQVLKKQNRKLFTGLLIIHCHII